MDRETLKQIREEIGFDKVSLALELNIAYRTMQDYEGGQRRIPEHIAEKMIALRKQNKAWVKGYAARIDARAAKEFPNGIVSQISESEVWA
jgi:predicted transcriptional regulator